MGKMATFGIGLGIGAVIMGVIAIVGLVAIVLLAAWMGYVPILSTMMGTAKAKDLGVTFTPQDYYSGMDKIPGFSMKNVEYACLTCDYTSSGSVPVDTRFTQEEFTAQVNAQNSENGPIKDVQVKFNNDGTVEASGITAIPQLENMPVYIKGGITDYSSRNLDVSLDAAEVGGLGVSGEQLAQAEQLINELIDTYIGQNPGFSIDTISIDEGGIDFDGTLPAMIEGLSAMDLSEYGY